MLSASSDALVLIVHIVCLLIVLVVSISTILRRRLLTAPALYADRDGAASPESAGGFSDRGPRVAVVGWIVLGVGLGVVRVVVEGGYSGWVRLGAWVLLLGCYAAVVKEREYVVRFRLFAQIGVGCAAVTAMLFADACNRYEAMTLSGPSFILLCCESLVSLLGCISALLIPRRPDVFRNGIIVDRQSTTSLLNRLSFGWVSTILSHQRLAIDNLPELEYSNRSSNLHHSFKTARTTSSLWRVLATSHQSALCLQLLLTILNSVLAFTPQISLLAILRAFETDQDDRSFSIWVSVLGLGVSIIVSATVENWNYYISSNIISVRLYEQLSTVIYDKILTAQSNEKHDTINLLSNDSKRIADFAALNFLLYEAPLKICIAAISIGKLLGLSSLLAGTAVLVLLTLMNIYAIIQYASTQKRLMHSRDGKMASIIELLHGIRQIKFSALEELFAARVNGLRDEELQHQWNVFKWEILVSITYTIAPVLVFTACLVTYALQNESVPASVAFTAMSLFAVLDVPLAVLPQMVLNGASANISLRRIKRFLRSPDRSFYYTPATDIVFQQATLAYKDNPAFSLNKLNIVFPSGALSVITGPTGSGKSLLLSAILGECEIHGNIHLPSSSIAYVSQTPWLKDGTIKENILFGLPHTEARYRAVLFACCLNQDINTLPHGDCTHISNGSSSLSGGQKWRITLARALYSQAEIIVLDDLFSSVDAHTARHLYEHALMGELGVGRTRILATHHGELCCDAECVVDLGEGGVLYSASSPKEDEVERAVIQEGKGVDIPETRVERDYQEYAEFDSSEKWKSRRMYLNLAGGKYLFMLLLLLHLLYTILIVGRGAWLNLWSNNSTSSPTTNTTLYLGIYLALSLFSCLFAILRSYLAISITLTGSKHLFHTLLSAILHAPLGYFTTIPTGRILNLFSADFATVDSRLGYDFNSAFSATAEPIAITIAACFVNPYLALLSLFSLVIAIYHGTQFIHTIHQIKQLENALRGPIFDLMRSSIEGITTIRAFRQTDSFRGDMFSHIDRHCRASWSIWLLIRWISMRLSFIGAVFAVAGCIILTLTPGVTPATAGFAIAFIMRYSSVMASAIRQYANLEMTLNSVERVTAATDIPAGNYSPIYSQSPPAAWPTTGQIDVLNLSIAYSPSSPPVLSNLSFSIPTNTRVGIVGRTGAGKSSLALALFRFLEAQQGSITIDGIDISTIPLENLRRRLAIVPQDPVLFEGSIRSNIDPWDEYSDGEIMAALARVHWIPDDDAEYEADSDTRSIHSLWLHNPFPSDEAIELSRTQARAASLLSTPISPNGSNLSLGQRQRLHLAKAILLKPKILLLDEATSSIDKTTDALLQETIREEFGRNESTLLVIAHRLSSVIDFDTVLVMDGGRVVEFGSPRELVDIQGGVFRGLVEGSSEREGLMGVLTS